MRMNRMPAALAGAGLPLVLCATTSADFIQLLTVEKSITGFEGLVASVVNVYARFSDNDGDGIGDGAVLGVGGLPGMTAHVSVNDGVFYQNALNTNNAGRTAPPQQFLDVFPSLGVDTFLTFGLKVVPTGLTDTTTLSAGFPSEGGFNANGFWDDDKLVLFDAMWFPADTGSGQARPGNFDNPADMVLIGQFSVAAGAGPQHLVIGDLIVQGEQGDGTAFQVEASFIQGNPPAPGTLAVLAAAGLLSRPRRRRRP